MAMANEQGERNEVTTEQLDNGTSNVVAENDRFSAAMAELRFTDDGDAPDPPTPAPSATGEGGESKTPPVPSAEGADGSGTTGGAEGGNAEGADGDTSSEEPKGDPPGHAWKALRRQERQLKEAESRVLQKLEEAEKRIREREERLERLERLAKSDPDAYYREIGEDPDQVYVKQTRKRLQQEDPLPPVVQEKLSALEKKIQEYEERDKKKEQEAQRAQASQQVRAIIEHYGVQAEEGVVRYPGKGGVIVERQMKEVAPNFVKLPPELRRARMESATAWVLKNEPDMDYLECLKRLDELAKPEVDYILKQAQGQDTPGSESQKPGGRGSRKPEQPRNGSGVATIHNTDVAQSSGTQADDQSWEARRRRAEEALRFEE